MVYVKSVKKLLNTPISRLRIGFWSVLHKILLIQKKNISEFRFIYEYIDYLNVLENNLSYSDGQE